MMMSSLASRRSLHAALWLLRRLRGPAGLVALLSFAAVLVPSQGYTLFADEGLIGREWLWPGIGTAIGVVSLGLGLWLLWLELRALQRGLQSRSRWLRIPVWAGVGLALILVTMEGSWISYAMVIDAKEVLVCNTVTFPSRGYCRAWNQRCKTVSGCTFRHAWMQEWATIDLQKPRDRETRIEARMRGRHIKKGWLDYSNPAHRRAVNEDWAALNRYFERRFAALTRPA